MYLSCDHCRYDSGDHDDDAAVAAKVNADGGRMVQARDGRGQPAGWEATCPNGHGGTAIHID
jgi:hypothetical protein